MYCFQFFLFFSFLMHVNVRKGIDQLNCYLEIPKTELHWVNDLSSKEAEFKSLVKLYPTYKTKQKNENIKWTVHFLAIATYA